MSTWVTSVRHSRQPIPFNSGSGLRAHVASGFALPSGLAPARARELQGAVARGIQYWQRRPFELAIDTHPTPSVEVDIEISWGEGLSGSQIGLIHTKSSLDQFEVLGITLATLSPNLKYGRTPEEVPLTAAHEIGHALGLPHSDSHRDVVYPTNTTRNLTPRDFRTVEVLYRLPSGARIRRNPWQSFLSVETVLLDLLVEVGPGHTDPAGRLAHVPIVGAKFVCDVGHLGVLLELAETFKVEEHRA